MSYKDYRIKSRLADLNKTQTDLLQELGNMSFTISKSELSDMIRGVKQTPKAQQILEESHKIICEWERK